MDGNNFYADCQHPHYCYPVFYFYPLLHFWHTSPTSFHRVKPINYQNIQPFTDITAFNKVSVCCGEETAEPEGKAFNLQVDPSLNCYLWSGATDRKNEIVNTSG